MSLNLTIDFKHKSISFESPKIMGVLNMTPDSFYPGSCIDSKDEALVKAQQMVSEGADFIDVGGESTRPGTKSVTTHEELDRVIPVVEIISKNLDTIVSIDTSCPDVMQEAISAGATMVNDIRALQKEGAMEVLAKAEIPVSLMHMKGNPQTMQDNPEYDDVVTEVTDFLAKRISACEKNGIKKENIIVDPGFGFGKNDMHNLLLVENIPTFKTLGCPVLLGVSRKSTIGRILEKVVEERLFGSIALQTLAAYKGASIIRTHDVKETSDALKIVNAINYTQH